MDRTGVKELIGLRSSRSPSAKHKLFKRLQRLDCKIRDVDWILTYRREGRMDYNKSAGETEALLIKRAELDAKRREVREERKELCLR